MRVTTNTRIKNVKATLYTRDDGPPFVCVNLNGEGGNDAAIYLNTTADCDELIKAAAEAKRLLTGQGHLFIRPGQVAPDRPAPDKCMTCGQPESQHHARGDNPYPPAASTISVRFPDTGGIVTGPADGSEVLRAIRDGAVPYIEDEGGRP